MPTRRLQTSEPEARMIGASEMTLGPQPNYDRRPAMIIFVRTPVTGYFRVDAP